MRNTQVRTLLAGLVLAVSGAVLTITGAPIGVTETWPVLLLAGVGLVIGVPRLQHAAALVAGILAGTVTLWIASAVLPALPVGRAIATFVGVLLLTVVTLASSGRIRLSVQLVGWAATLAHSGSAVADAPTGGLVLLRALGDGAATLLVAAGIGLLLAQVTQLVASGTPGRPRRGGTAAVTVLAAGGSLLATVVLGAAPALADTADPYGSVEHHQTVVRSVTADGLPLGGQVVTRVSASGTGGVTVVLRDQAVRGLRSLTGLRGPGALRERGAPEVVGRTVTHHLSDGAVVRTVATLDREPPVGLEVTITLDGRPVTASQVVGRSGRLEVTYTLVNRTAEARELRYFDGAGRPRTTVRDLAVPMVGELVVGLDDRFRAVRADGATFVDGTLRAELVLAEPVGAPVATVSWSADVRDGAVPPVHVRLAPVALTDTARGGVDVERLRRSTAALREVSDTAGLALTGVQALGSLSNRTADRADDDLAMRTAAILVGLLDGVAVAGAELGELRALIERQDERARAGEGAVHGLLADDDVRRTAAGDAGNARPRVSTAAVYVLDIAGTADGGLPGTFPRLLLALVLLAAAGSLGRSIARLTGSA